MSDDNKDLHEVTEPRPLRSMLKDGDLDAEARLLGQALQAMHDEPLAEKPPAWSAIEEQALRMARRRRWRYHLGEAWRGIGPLQLAASAAAVVFLLVLGTLGVRSLSSSTLEANRGAGRVNDAPPADVRPQIALQSLSTLNKITLRCGAQVELADGQAEIEQREAQRPAIHLRSGRVSLQVPPLRGGQLSVTTGDAEVIVHGTRFTVTRQETEDATRVEVEEGLVEVRPRGGKRSAIFLRAGEHTLVPSSAAFLKQLGVQVGALIDGARCDAEAGRVLDAYLDAATAETDVSGAMYLHGSCAATRGDVASALQSFETVAARATSELRADNALARIAQLRASGSPLDGATAWRRYLERFPQGQHRESALRYLREHSTRKPD